MSTITLPNIRVGSDLQVRVRLKDGGVAIDWSTLSNIKAYVYSDAQRAMAGRCTTSVDGDDPTLLVCNYAATKPQYLGANRIVVSAKYMGVTKTYDKPAFAFVRWTADQEGEQITVEDPEVTVEIDVEDVSSSILQEAIDAALSAAEKAEEAAALVPLQVLQDCVEATEDANEAAEAANAAGITSVEASIADNEPGTPSVEATLLNKILTLVFHHLKGVKGDTGATPNITVGTVTTGEPGTAVVVTMTGTAENPVLNITIPQGLKGDQGNTGSSVDYPFELVNNLTTDDATKALSAAQGVVLDGKISQLQQEVDGNEFALFNEGKISAKIIQNQYVDNNGNFVPYIGWSRTDYINIRPFTRIKVTAVHASVYCAIYNAEKVRVDGFALTNGTQYHDVKDTQYYICVSDSTEYLEQVEFAIEGYKSDASYNIANALDKKFNAYALLEYPDSINGESVSGGFKMEVRGGVYLYCKDTLSGYYTIDGISERTISNNHLIAYCTTDASIVDSTSLPDQKTHIVLAIVAGGDIVGGVLLPYFQRKKMNTIGNLSDLETEQKESIVGAINELNGKIGSGELEYTIVKDSYVTTSGGIASYTGWDRTNYIAVGKHDKVKISIESNPVNYIYNYWYDVNKSPLARLTLTANEAEYEVPSGAEYMVISNNATAMATLEVTAEGKAPLDEDNILSLNPRSLYDGQIIQMSGKYGNGRISGIVPPVVLAWFSDIHADGVNLARVNEFCERYSTRLSDIISSGDNVLSHYEDSYEFWADNGGGPVITALGNHDAWTDDNDPDIVEGGYQGETLFLVKPKLCYDKFFAPYISGWGVNQPSDAATSGKCYFYKDYTYTEGGTISTILRMIVLDCMHYNIYSDLVNGASVQDAWLRSCLEGARTNGIPVLIVSHYKGDNISYLDCPWSSRDYQSEDITPLAKTAVKDFLDAGGELVCWLNGHDHFDIIGTFLSDSRQLQIGIETAKCPDTWGDSERVSGTKTQDCFNILAVDTRDKLIKIVRVGDDYNRGLYHKGRLVYRYKAVDESHPQGLVLCE